MSFYGVARAFVCLKNIYSTCDYYVFYQMAVKHTSHVFPLCVLSHLVSCTKAGSGWPCLPMVGVPHPRLLCACVDRKHESKTQCVQMPPPQKVTEWF